MPKVLDEDQLRRKQALEEKRAARRQAKHQQEAKAADTKDNKGASSDQLDGKSQASATTKNAAEGSELSCRFLDLPEDAIHLIYIMLTAADLGRLAGTCKRLTLLLANARTHVVRARCSRTDMANTGRVRFMELCTNEVDAQALLTDSYGGGDTGRVVPRNKFPKKDPPPYLEFCSYARYLQEVATGISSLSTGAREPIPLPRFVQGRMASISPEHSLCRVGGDGTKCGGGGSGVASWGVGRRGQVGLW